jgi:ABC-2 type transport system permease protein
MNFADVLHSEWTKLRSVRSTYWTGLVAVLATIGVCVIVCIKWADDMRHSPGTTIDATTVSLNGIFLAQVAVGTLGVMVISSEYGTGMIRATFGAVPQRRAGASLGQPEVLRAVIGGGLYLAAVGLLGFGIGALVRHTAGALSAFFGVLFAVTALADLLPTSWRNDVMPYMPANAGTQIFAVQRTHDSLAPWTGLGVLCPYAVAAITTATVLVTRRDA